MPVSPEAVGVSVEGVRERGDAEAVAEKVSDGARVAEAVGVTVLKVRVVEGLVWVIERDVEGEGLGVELSVNPGLKVLDRVVDPV